MMIDRAMRYCRVRISAFQFKFDVRINDVSLADLPGERNLSTSFNINEWVREGENLLTVDLSGNGPDVPHSALIRIDIGFCAEPQGTDFSSILSLELKKGDEAAGVTVRPFKLPKMPFGTYDEQVLETIDPADREQLIAFRRAYEGYYLAMASKDIEAVLRFHGYRADAYALRYYETTAHRLSELRTGLANSFANEFLLKRIPDLEKINAHMAGRLITMDYADDGMPLTTFTGPQADYTREYQAYWGRNRQGEFFIYR